MATVPGQLIWEIVKKNNCFLVKEFGRGNASVQFSKETNNLYNLNSFKHSGLANKKTVTIQPVGKDHSVLLATTKTKKQNKPSTLLHKSLMKKEFRRMADAVANQILNMPNQKTRTTHIQNKRIELVRYSFFMFSRSPLLA
ncbi:large ribosomal subunit protein eL28y-like isoform X2 [Ziziphus jujuba]|uniref:Large ribosomal subunit protein eL28y-like isoform X2 n=1 Tax=Ziziphus jujuba TaxID=326968 RepID=A0ABM4AG12_ZIZJJ|nr:large ribosomal subunit protein eL28y-like isoform X2 [Ziziphus jujuba]